MQQLIRGIYVCTGTPRILEDEALTLLKQARVANRKHDITGMLLYVGGLMVASFEGKPRMVGAVCSTLFRDKPRMRLRQVVSESIDEREFSEWTMGFSAVDASEAGGLLGDAELFSSATQVERLDPEGAKTLMTILGRRLYQSDRSGMYRVIKTPPSLLRSGG